MIGTVIAGIAGKVMGGIFDTVDKVVPDKDLAAKLKSALQTQVLDLLKTEIEGAVAVITAEINSGHWLAANWRPMLMCLFGIIIANNYIVYPYLSLFFDKAPMLEIPEDMWGLLKIGIGGYVVGRSVEKGVQVWKDK